MKGVNPLERGSQTHFMAEFVELIDFPPAPKLNVLGRLDRSKAAQNEFRGEELFFAKAQCSTCHTPPYYTESDGQPSGRVVLQAKNGKWHE